MFNFIDNWMFWKQSNAAGVGQRRLYVGRAVERSVAAAADAPDVSVENSLTGQEDTAAE